MGLMLWEDISILFHLKELWDGISGIGQLFANFNKSTFTALFNGLVDQALNFANAINPYGSGTVTAFDLVTDGFRLAKDIFSDFEVDDTYANFTLDNANLFNIFFTYYYIVGAIVKEVLITVLTAGAGLIKTAATAIGLAAVAVKLVAFLKTIGIVATAVGLFAKGVAFLAMKAAGIGSVVGKFALKLVAGFSILSSFPSVLGRVIATGGRHIGKTIDDVYGVMGKSVGKTRKSFIIADHQLVEKVRKHYKD